MFRLGLGSFFLFLPLVFLVFAGGLLLTNGIFPGLALIAMVLSVNLLGDWLRDALNPKLR